MKKLLFSVFIVALALVVLAQQDVLWSRLNWLDAPRVHVVQKGESLSKLAKDSYGATDYWRELALINRAPKPDHIQPGEEVLLPAANVLQELRRARTISRVNDLINEQQALATRVAPATEQTATQPAPATNATPAQALPEQSSNVTPPSANDPAPFAATVPADPPRFDVENTTPIAPESNDSGSSWFWVIFGLLALGGVIGFVVYRRRQEEEEMAHVQEEKTKTNGAQDSRNFQMDRRSHNFSKVEKATV